MTTQQQAGILLESGTNEVEILEFYVHGQSFGINVAKIQEIVQYREELVTKLPEQPHAIRGSYLVRKNMHLLVDMQKHLFNTDTVAGESGSQQVVLITEFNKNKTGFLLEAVNRIYRCTWDKLTPIANYALTDQIAVLGTINVEGRDIVILDLESILGHLIPTFDRLDKMDVESQSHNSHVPEREHARIIIAEDSTYIREHLVRNLKSIGYINITEYQDGKSALDAISMLHQKAQEEQTPLNNYITAIISDIEMPCLDGLSLCNRLRNQLMIKNIPIILFSSLVNEQMKQKCISVGGDACLNKADAKQLVELLDYHCLKSEDLSAEAS